jgi:predicted phosphodiesterase
MNPGSISEPRGGNHPTYGVLNIFENGAVVMEIVEYKD